MIPRLVSSIRGAVRVLSLVLLLHVGVGQSEGEADRMRRVERGPDLAPAVGAEAPNFNLKTREGDRQVELAGFRGKKPVVLVFGSYT